MRKGVGRMWEAKSVELESKTQRHAGEQRVCTTQAAQPVTGS